MLGKSTFKRDYFSGGLQEYVGLLCLQPAKEGGESRLISFESVYNRLLDGHPTGKVSYVFLM